VADDLPEGGFGWYLIRTLARDVRYDRNGVTNCLTFWLPATESEIADIPGAATCI
jgi:serine/threonine-protein kinase RsbW